MIRICFAILALIGAAPAGAGLLQEMVQLDRTYIPVLALTNQPGKQTESARAMARFDASWRDFRVASGARAEPGLAAVLNEADKHFVKARGEIEAGRLREAHDALEHLRHALMQWRSGRGIAYFPDLLTAYHDEMEQAADAATEPSQRNKLAGALASARARWEDVRRAKFDGGVHGFDQTKLATMRTLIHRESDALDALDRLRDGGSDAELAGAAKLLKGTFAQLYLLFGDFDLK